MRQLLIALALTFNAAVAADDAALINEASFPAQWREGSQIMPRQGQIVLTYLWADIYAAALYTASGVPPQQAFDQQRDLPLELFYLRDLKHSDIIKASATILERQHPPTVLTPLVPELKKLQDSFGDIKRGDRLTLNFSPQRGLNLERNGKVIFNSQNPALAKTYLGIWLAPDGLPENLRKTLMKLTP